MLFWGIFLKFKKKNIYKIINYKCILYKNDYVCGLCGYLKNLVFFIK